MKKNLIVGIVLFILSFISALSGGYIDNGGLQIWLAFCSVSSFIFSIINLIIYFDN